MATIIRSEKNLDIPIKKGKINKNKKLSIIHINKNSKQNNLLKNTYNNKNEDFNSLKEIKLFNINDKIIKQDKYNYKLFHKLLNKESEKVLKFKNDNSSNIFICKQKRFKTINYKNDIPGPGQYFKENKNKKNKVKMLLRNKTLFQSNNSSISIPSKNTIINNSIEIISNSIEIKKNKNKGNCIEKKNIKIYKPLSLNINKEKIMNKNKNYILNNNDNSNYLVINHSLSHININTYKTQKNLDEYFGINKNNKIFKFLKGKIFKNSMFIDNIYKNNYDNNKKIITNDILGPGNYLSLNENNIKSKSKGIQNFGSFSIRNIFSKYNLYENYKNHFLIQLNHGNSKMKKSKSLLKTISKIKAFIKSKEKLLDKNFKEKRNLYMNNLDLGIYENKGNVKTYKKKINISRNKHFSSLEKRFPLIQSKTITPGPGSYLSLMDIEKNRLNNHSFIPKNIIENDIKGLSRIKINIFKDKIKHEKNKSPSVGEYYPEKYNSIEYFSQKINNFNKQNMKKIK